LFLFPIKTILQHVNKILECQPRHPRIAANVKNHIIFTHETSIHPSTQYSTHIIRWQL